MPNLVGQDVGRYHLVEQVGRGGMATVYKAFDNRLERFVAVKIIDTRLDDPSFYKRFEREAKSLARLSHANIVKVHDYGEENGIPYLVMEYVTSGTLKSYLGQPMPYQKAANLLAPIARSLQYAHKLGIVHRDIKPANILMDESGHPMLSDFGIAKMMESSDTARLTGTGVGIGTPEYMAPEQGQGNNVDQRADIYSLGVVFYELVTGHTPYQADTPMAVVLKHMLDPLPSPRQFAPGIPEEIELILYKALAKRPEERYQDMGEFAEHLERLTQRATTLQDGIPPLYPPGTQREGKLKTSSSWILWGGFGVTAVVGGVILMAVLAIILWRVQWGSVLGFSPRVRESIEAEDAAGRNILEIDRRIETLVPPISPADVGKTFNYNITLKYSEPLLLNLSWCADSKELLEENLNKMNFYLEVKNKEVPKEKRAEKRFTNNGNPCYAVYTLLDDWPKSTHELSSQYEFTEEVNDGWDTYPAGKISYNYKVNVSSSTEAPPQDPLGCVNTFDVATRNVLAGMKPIFCSGFEEGDNRWIRDDDDEFARTRSSLADGILAYQIDTKKGVYFHPEFPLRNNSLQDDFVFDNFGVSFTARRKGTSSNGMYGLYFRETDNQMFVFEINDTAQTFNIYTLLPGEWRPVKENTSNTNIIPGGWNTITAVAKGEQFSFYINGQPAYTFADTRLPRGRVGLAMEVTNPNENELFEFDNFLLVAP